ncbi:hypothetical protein HanPI659440_Chr10g0364691 [Helianthus annuus]|nr:hypothetical protein HanPI659440_Chr10g0364691 [Helianthus annuus]
MSLSSEYCLEGTIPIKRQPKNNEFIQQILPGGNNSDQKTTEQDCSNGGHEHAVGYVSGEQYNRAKASINVWNPNVTYRFEFRLSDISLHSAYD